MSSNAAALPAGFPAMSIAQAHQLLVSAPASPFEIEEREIRGVKITRLGRRSYDANDIIEKVDPRGRKYYWIGGNRAFGVENEGTDFGAVQAGYVSVSPVHLDLTNYPALVALAGWEARLSAPRGR